MENSLEGMDIEKSGIKQLRARYDNDYKPGVSIITPTFKRRYIVNIFENYSRSSYPVKELIVILNKNELRIAKYLKHANGLKNVSVYEMDEKYSLGKCLNFGISKSRYDYIAKMDDDDYYGSNYLTDLMNVFNYTDAYLTGKNPIFVYFEDSSSLYIHNNRKPVMGSTFLFKKEIFGKVTFRDLSFREDNYFLRDCINSGIKIHASDKYNYVYIRHSNLKDHTFRMPPNIFLQTYDTEKILTVKDFSPFVTV